MTYSTIEASPLVKTIDQKGWTIDGIDRSADPQTRLASLYARLPASAGVGQGESLDRKSVV